MQISTGKENHLKLPPQDRWPHYHLNKELDHFNILTCSAVDVLNSQNHGGFKTQSG